MHEDEVSKREREEEEIKRLAQAAQAAADEATRQVKLKKKGRKSKVLFGFWSKSNFNCLG